MRCFHQEPIQPFNVTKRNMQRVMTKIKGSASERNSVTGFYSFVLFGIAFVAIGACASNDETSAITCSGTAVTFTEANSVIQSSCTLNSGCHGSGSSRGPGPLLTYSQISNARNQIKTAVANGSMPEGSRLSTDQKSTIICWIENGASNN